MFALPSSSGRYSWSKGTWIAYWVRFGKGVFLKELICCNWGIGKKDWGIERPQISVEYGPYQDICVWVDRVGIRDVRRSRTWTRCYNRKVSDRRMDCVKACTWLPLTKWTIRLISAMHQDSPSPGPFSSTWSFHVVPCKDSSGSLWPSWLSGP